MEYNECSKQTISTSSLSDLVELGILSKQISKFTNDDIGTESRHLSVRFPNDNSRIKQYDGYSDWYWLRSHAGDSCSIIAIFPRGRSLSGYAFTSACGITPLIVLH